LKKAISIITIIWISAFSYRLVAIAIPLAMAEQIGLCCAMLEFSLYRAKKEEQDGSN